MVYADFIQFIAEKLELGANRTRADTKAVSSGLALFFPDLLPDETALTITFHHFIDFLDHCKFVHAFTP